MLEWLLVRKHVLAFSCMWIQYVAVQPLKNHLENLEQELRQQICYNLFTKNICGVSIMYCQKKPSGALILAAREKHNASRVTFCIDSWKPKDEGGHNV